MGAVESSGASRHCRGDGISLPGVMVFLVRWTGGGCGIQCVWALPSLGVVWEGERTKLRAAMVVVTLLFGQIIPFLPHSSGVPRTCLR